jgi:hypothetical protein
MFLLALLLILVALALAVAVDPLEPSPRINNQSHSKNTTSTELSRQRNLQGFSCQICPAGSEMGVSTRRIPAYWSDNVTVTLRDCSEMNKALSLMQTEEECNVTKAPLFKHFDLAYYCGCSGTTGPDMCTGRLCSGLITEPFGEPDADQYYPMRVSTEY